MAKIVKVGPIRRMDGPNVFGDVKDITLDCGHTYQGDPCTMRKVGDCKRCTQCENERRRERNQAMLDLGLVRVCGSLGGVYWE